MCGMPEVGQAVLFERKARPVTHVVHECRLKLRCDRQVSRYVPTWCTARAIYACSRPSDPDATSIVVCPCRSHASHARREGALHCARTVGIYVLQSSRRCIANDFALFIHIDRLFTYDQGAEVSFIIFSARASYL